MFNIHCGYAGAQALRKRIMIAHELCAEAANHFSSRDHEKALQTLSLARKIAAEAELIIAGGVLRRSMWNAFRKLLSDLRSRIESVEPDHETVDAMTDMVSIPALNDAAVQTLFVS